MVRPPIDTTDILEILGGLFSSAVDGLAPIGTGQIASAFSFTVGDGDYIVRFVAANMATSFQKDRLMSSRLASSAIAVPDIIHIGRFGDYHFAVSPKYPGVPLDRLSEGDYRALVRTMIENLDAIRQIDISDTKNYGEFDGEGVGKYPTWRSLLLSVTDEEPEGTFYGKWHWMFEGTLLDREYFDHICRRMESLLEFCPEERYLVHADYGFGNALAEDGNITAVLDWANAMYGDFVYDIAWLDLGSPELDFQTRTRQYYEGKGLSIGDYRERIACYQCYICLDSQKWYAKSNKAEDNHWMRRRITGILEDFDRGCDSPA